MLTSADLLAALNDKVINGARDIKMKDFRGILPLIRFGEPRLAESGYKLSWLDGQIKARGSSLDGDITDIATTVNVAAGEGVNFRPGMVISGKNSNEVMLVTAVTTDALTVTRGFGGTTAEALLDGAEIKIDSVGNKEGSLASDDPTVGGERVENYFQTMDTTITMTRRAQSTASFDFKNDLAFQLDNAMTQLMNQLNRALIRGRRATATIGGQEYSYTGGVKFFTDQTGAIKVSNSGAALTLNAIDNIVEKIVLEGGSANTVVANTKKARELNALMSAKYNPRRLQEYQLDQQGLTQLPSDLPLAGFVTNIVLDDSIGDNELLMVDTNAISIIPMADGGGGGGSWRTLDATPKGADYVSARIIGDLGLEIKNSKTNMAQLYNIA